MFMWIIIVIDEGYLNIVRNMEFIGVIYISVFGVKNVRISIGIMVGDVIIGDNVYVCFSIINFGIGEIVSVFFCKLIFFGWRFF